MVLSITIGGTPAIIKAGSFSAKDVIGQTSVANFTVILARNSTKFAKGQQVVISIKGEVLYSGYIRNIRESSPDGSAIILQDIDVIDQHYLTNRKYISIDIKDADASTAVRNMVTSHLAADGVTYTTASIPTGVTNNVTVTYSSPTPLSSIIEDISKRIKYWWTIDNEKVVWFCPIGTLSTGVTIKGSDVVKGTALVNRQNDKYVNKCTILNAIGAKEEHTDGFVGANSTTYTLAVSVSEMTSISAPGVSDVTWGKYGLDSGKDFYYTVGSKTLICANTAKYLGYSFNVTYQGVQNITVTYQDATEISAKATIEGGSGVVEYIFDCGSTMTSAQATSYAQSLVEARKTDYIRFSFDTYVPGLFSGGQAVFTLPEYGFSSTTLIVESVSYVIKGSAVLYSVVATNMPLYDKWTESVNTQTSMVANNINTRINTLENTITASVGSPPQPQNYAARVGTVTAINGTTATITYEDSTTGTARIITNG